jgi:hypothetical protein
MEAQVHAAEQRYGVCYVQADGVEHVDSSWRRPGAAFVAADRLLDRFRAGGGQYHVRVLDLDDPERGALDADDYAGTFELPLEPGDTVCRGCEEEGLEQRDGFNPLEELLALGLSDEDREAFRHRVEVRCRSCGWAGSAWRSET